MAKLKVEWHDDDTAIVMSNSVQVATLRWHNFIADWGVTALPADAEARWLRVDPEAAQEAMEEHSKVLSQPESVRAPLEAELAGRLKMLRDETRDMAVIGAKALARRWIG